MGFFIGAAAAAASSPAPEAAVTSSGGGGAPIFIFSFNFGPLALRWFSLKIQLSNDFFHSTQMALTSTVQ
jgi:hypothetical protein